MMWMADRWEEYQVLDASKGQKLERWGKYILVRPDPQVLWETDMAHPGWKKPHARYHRSSKGGGEWEFLDLPEQWELRYHGLAFHLKPFAFKHTGIFPEQAANWDWFGPLLSSQAHSSPRPRVLNLFAYTGAASLQAAAAGAQVTHVDASKGMVHWARENALLSGLGQAPIRWIVDDCVKFVEREIRRGSQYEAILLDPPSYGRGPKGEIWKLEDQVFTLLAKCSRLLSPHARFFLINSYTTGLQAGVLEAMLRLAIGNRPGGKYASGELGLPISSRPHPPRPALDFAPFPSEGHGFALPCGACCRWWRED